MTLCMSTMYRFKMNTIKNLKKNENVIEEVWKCALDADAGALNFDSRTANI